MMRIGLQLPSFSFPGAPASIGPHLAEIGQAAEDAGFESLWVMDHFFQVPEETGWGGPEHPMLEAYTTLGFLARCTSRIRLGAMVGGVHFRSPAVVLKAATTLDVLSGGRAWLGIGAGWYQREAIGLGLPWPPRKERFDRLEEVLQIAHHVWSGRREPFIGPFTRMEEPFFAPLPVTQPHPPILVGGAGERRTLRLVATYADACNILVPDPGESRRKLEVLKRHCEEVGRPYEAIEKTALVEVDVRRGRESSRDVVAKLRQQADEGIEHVIVNMPDVHDLAHLRRFRDEIIPELDAVAIAA